MVEKFAEKLKVPVESITIWDNHFGVPDTHLNPEEAPPKVEVEGVIFLYLSHNRGNIWYEVEDKEKSMSLVGELREEFERVLKRVALITKHGMESIADAYMEVEEVRSDIPFASAMVYVMVLEDEFTEPPTDYEFEKEGLFWQYEQLTFLPNESDAFVGDTWIYAGSLNAYTQAAKEGRV